MTATHTDNQSGSDTQVIGNQKADSVTQRVLAVIRHVLAEQRRLDDSVHQLQWGDVKHAPRTGKGKQL